MLLPTVIKDRRSFIELSPSVMDAAARDCSEQHKRGNAVLASYTYVKISAGMTGRIAVARFFRHWFGNFGSFRRDCGPQR